MPTVDRPFHEIVQARLDELGENAFSMAAKSGISYDKFRSLLRTDDRKADAKVETAREICRALGLELYIGPPRDLGNPPPVAEDQQFAHIPLHEATLAAGGGIDNGSEEVIDHLAFRRSWLRRIGVAPSNAKVARVAGESMLPAISPGDMVLIDTSRNAPPIRKRGPRDTRPATIYAFLDSGSARVKRIERPEAELMMLLSDNPAFGPEVLNGPLIARLQIIGKVVWWGHTVQE